MGRAGRFGGKAVAISLTPDKTDEEDKAVLRQLRSMYGVTLDVLPDGFHRTYEG